MEDTALQRAIRHRDRLQKEIAEIDLFLKLHQKFSDGTEKELTIPNAGQRNEESNSSDSIQRSRNLPKQEMSREVRSMMLERQRPMTRTDIVDGLEERGIPVAGQDKARAIGTIMWRLRDQFVNLPGYGYWPIDTQCPAAGYMPENTNQEKVGDESEPNIFR